MTTTELSEMSLPSRECQQGRSTISGLVSLGKTKGTISGQYKKIL